MTPSRVYSLRYNGRGDCEWRGVEMPPDCQIAAKVKSPPQIVVKVPPNSQRKYVPAHYLLMAVLSCRDGWLVVEELARWDIRG